MASTATSAVPSSVRSVSSAPPASAAGRLLARRRLAGLAVLVAAGLATLTGCGSGSPDAPTVASLAPASQTATDAVSPSATPDDSSGASGATPSALAYSRCMRSHGVGDFPDPGADGEIRLEAGPGSDLDMNNPTFQAADDACKALLPDAGGKPSAEIKAANIKYAQCMRDNGVTDFPDPNADGALQIQSAPGSDLDPDNPTYKAADEVCKQYLPDGGAGQQLNSHDG